MRYVIAVHVPTVGIVFLPLALAASVYVAPVAALFRFEPLAAQDLLIAVIAGVTGVLVVEAARWVLRSRRAN